MDVIEKMIREKIVIELDWDEDGNGKRIYNIDGMTKDFNEQLQKFVDREEFRVGGKMEQEVSRIFDEDAI